MMSLCTSVSHVAGEGGVVEVEFQVIATSVLDVGE